MMGLRSRYGLPIYDEEVECTGKTEWCKKVKGAIYRFAPNELNTASKASYNPLPKARDIFQILIVDLLSYVIV